MNELFSVVSTTQRMRPSLPISLLFFIATGVAFGLQAIPWVGIFLMFLAAPYWSIVLVNAGMLGISFEAFNGRVSRWWLTLPFAFYGGYYVVAVQDHLRLHALTQSFDTANARVNIPFDLAHQVLVFGGDGSDLGLTQNYALPVAYSANSNFPEQYLSHRMMEISVCTQVRGSRALQAAFVHAFGFFDGDGISARRMEGRFCALSMPERPAAPQVRVSQKEEKAFAGWLPVTRTTRTITTPDGQSFQLLDGVAAPLSWIPMPVMGCTLNSGAPSWDCVAGFRREGFTPIVSGKTRYGRGSAVLASALGLKPVAIADRRSGDAAPVLAKIAFVEQETLTRQLVNIDLMIADPLAKVVDWQVGVVSAHPEVLDSHADAIMTGIERAAAVEGTDRYRAREGGRILAGLLAYLPRDRLVAFSPRLLAVYARADDKHWLWEAGTLIRRLGDLGTDALPFLVNPRALSPSIDKAGIEGLCRVGPPGRAVAEPVLLAMWTNPNGNFTRDDLSALLVAMRRIGISPPPLAEDKRNPHGELQTEWADISPSSPARVCATRAERQARRQEKYGGKRLTNLD